MAREGLLHLSEDDLRSKIVYSWLKDCGFSDNNIMIEYSIPLKIGKGIKTIYSRCDVLVKNEDGQNLLIIEVKNPEHNLVSSDKHQALSYARALAEGGIAPFTVLTNGASTIIFDSVTGEDIGSYISHEHNYVKNGFKASGDAIIAKAEALEYLISISSDNLLCFCKAQTEQKMKLLRNLDIYSGKKYIPQLYVERKHISRELKEKLFDEKKPNNLLLVVGPPQHGKTCFLCNTIESYLEDDIPVLFYPAVSIRNSLLEEIKSDFDWSFSDNLSEVQIVHKLQRIAERTGKKMILFIDGWNEMLAHAFQLNDECQRLLNGQIQVVISTTSPSLTRLLHDSAWNLTYIAEETNLSLSAIRHLTTKPLKNTKEISIVQIGAFEYDEMQKGIQLHEANFNTKFSKNINLSNDPFYLRLAAESYANTNVPSFATRTQLIQEGLIRKAQRRGIGEIDLFSELNELSQIILINDTPLSCLNLPHILQNEERISLYTECAILIRYHEKGIPEVDFYYTHDKDLCIAIINRKLNEKLILSSDEDKYEELIFLCKTESGQSALKWFLSCPEYCYILEEIFRLIVEKNSDSTVILKILSDSILTQVSLNRSTNFDWLEKYIDKMLLSPTPENTFIDNFNNLIFSFLNSIDREKDKEKYQFWVRILLKYDISIEELGIQECLICQYYGVDDIKNYFEDAEYTTLDLDLFDQLVLDPDNVVAENAAKVLTYAYPLHVQKKIPFFFEQYKSNNLREHFYILENSCKSILHELYEIYYGSMCPGWLSHAEPGDEDIIEEFEKQKELWWPILRNIISTTELYSEIVELLNDLSKFVLNEDLDDIPFADPNQYKLGF
jgi:Type I restriction enzyme R protein N terminus (HSDR_N)